MHFKLITRDFFPLLNAEPMIEIWNENYLTLNELFYAHDQLEEGGTYEEACKQGCSSI